MTMLTCAHSHMVTVVDRLNLLEVLPEASGTAGFFWNSLSFDCFPIVCSQTGRLKRAAETGRPQINIYLPNVRGEERCTLLPVAGDVDNPMLSRSLLFIMSLVLRCGIRIIDICSMVSTLFPHCVTMS